MLRSFAIPLPLHLQQRETLKKTAWDEWLDGQEKNVLQKLQKKINYHSKKVQNERWVQKYGSENQEQPLCLLYKLVSWLILIKSLQYNLIFLNLDHNLLQKNKEKSKVILHVAHIQSSQA